MSIPQLLTLPSFPPTIRVSIRSNGLRHTNSLSWQSNKRRRRDAYMEEPRQDLRQFKLNLPTVTERVAQHAQYKVELKPSHVPVLPFLKQQSPSRYSEATGADKHISQTSKQSNTTIASFNVLSRLPTRGNLLSPDKGIRLAAEAEGSMTETAIDDHSQRVRHVQHRDKQRHRSLSEPLPPILTDGTERNWVLDRRRHKTEQTFATNLPSIHLPFLRGLDDQYASGRMYHSRPGASSISYLNDLRRSVLSKNSRFRMTDAPTRQALDSKPTLNIPPIVIDEVKTVASSEESKDTPDTVSYSESLWPAASDDGSTDCAPPSDYTMGETSPEPDDEPTLCDELLTKVPIVEIAEEQVATSSDNQAELQETDIDIAVEMQREEETGAGESRPQTRIEELPPTVTTTARATTPVMITSKPANENVAFQPAASLDSLTTETANMNVSGASTQQVEAIAPPAGHTTPPPPKLEEKENHDQQKEEEIEFIFHDRGTDGEDREMSSDNEDHATRTTSRKKKTSTTSSKGQNLQTAKTDKRRRQTDRKRQAKTDKVEDTTRHENSEMAAIEEDTDIVEQQDREESETSVANEEQQIEEKGENVEESETRPSSGEQKDEDSSSVVAMLQNRRRKDRERRRIAKREKREVRKREELKNQDEVEVTREKREEIEEKEGSHHCLKASEVEETVIVNETDSEEEKERLRREEEEKRMLEEMQRIREEEERRAREEERRQQEEIRRKRLEEQKRMEEEQRRQEELMRERIRKQIEQRRAMALERQVYASHLQMEMENINQGLQITPPFVWSYYPPQSRQTALVNEDNTEPG